jgi:hypothetical protein
MKVPALDEIVELLPDTGKLDELENNEDSSEDIEKDGSKSDSEDQ